MRHPTRRCRRSLREVVEDLEVVRAVASAAAAAELDQRIESIALAHQIASRLTSWFAATETATVDPRAPIRRTRVPQELPHGMDAEGLGLPRQRLRLGRTLAMGPAPRGKPSGTLGRGLVVRQDTRRAPRPPSEPVETLGGAGAAPPEERSAAASAPTAPRRGRVLYWKDGELVIEVESDGAAFDPATITAVGVELEDGQILDALVDVARSTPAGNPAAGLWLRLTLRVAGPAPASIRSVVVFQGSITWTVVM